MGLFSSPAAPAPPPPLPPGANPPTLASAASIMSLTRPALRTMSGTNLTTAAAQGEFNPVNTAPQSLGGMKG